MRDRHPRSAMGLTADRQTLILVAVDGRDSPTSVGMYGAELAALMADLGAWEAFNLDGGGSTAMWSQADGYVNDPSDGTARSVANHWGVFAGEAGGRAVEPGSCFAPGGCFPTALAGAVDEPFGDMPPGSYGHDEAIALLDASWVSGCKSAPTRLYCPRCGLKRGAAAKLAIEGAGLTATAPAAPTFDDVGPGSALYESIETAVAAGLMTGCSPTSFCPSDPVSRAELAGIITRAAGWSPGDPPAGPSFDDVPPTVDIYPDVEALAEHCAAEPCAGGGFCPDDPVMRDEAAIMLARAFGLVAVQCEPESPGDGSGGDGSGGDGSGGDGGTGPATSGGDGTSFGGEALPGSGGGAGDGSCACTSVPRPGPAALLFGLCLVATRRRRAPSPRS